MVGSLCMRCVANRAKIGKWRIHEKRKKEKEKRKRKERKKDLESEEKEDSALGKEKGISNISLRWLKRGVREKKGKEREEIKDRLTGTKEQ